VFLLPKTPDDGKDQKIKELICYTLKNFGRIVSNCDLPVSRALLPLLKTGTMTACFHRVGNFLCKKLILKMLLRKLVKISVKLSTIKLGTSS
jgi:hypothetical protein